MPEENSPAGIPQDSPAAADLAAKLRERARSGVLTCAQLYAFARAHRIELERMRPVMLLAGIAVKDCDQPCISLRCKHFK